MEDWCIFLMVGISVGFVLVFGMLMVGVLFGLEVLVIGCMCYDVILFCFVVVIVVD